MICLSTTALWKPKLRRLKWLCLFHIEVHYSVRIVFGSVCIDGENKRRMNKWVSHGGIWCVMNYSYVITMWRELWNVWDKQTPREICVQQNSDIWRICNPENCRQGWGKTANSYLKKLSSERFWFWVRSSDLLLAIGHKCKGFGKLK